MDSRCMKCYYVEQCARSDGRGDQCEHYMYIGLEVDDDELIDQMVEDNRIEFFDQWLIYLEEE